MRSRLAAAAVSRTNSGVYANRGSRNIAGEAARKRNPGFEKAGKAVMVVTPAVEPLREYQG